MMSFPIHVNTISMGLSILYFNLLANSADPDEMCLKHGNLSPILTVPVEPRYIPMQDSRYTVMHRDTFHKK